MTRFPHDQFAKDCLESLLSPFGQVQTSLKISSEVREIDVYFTPDPSLSPAADLGLLSQCAQNAAVFEPYRNSVKVPQIRACMSKLYDLHSHLIREAKRNVGGEAFASAKASPLENRREPGDDKLPMLWILTPTLSQEILASFGARLDLETWGEGVYLLPPSLETGIIVIHQLPKTPATIWFRLLGKDRVQARAIDEVRALPREHPYRENALELLGNLRVILEARETIEPEEQELIMQLSPLYLEKIQAAERVGEERGKAEGKAEEGRSLVVRLLTRKLGNLSQQLQSQVNSLPIDRVESLGEALLDFTSIADLENWLSHN